MWDENKFFEDFAKENDKIQPSQEFLDKMTDMVKEESFDSKIVSFNNRRKKVFTSVAAACVVAVFATGVFILTNNNSNVTDEQKYLAATESPSAKNGMHKFSPTTGNSDAVKVELKTELESGNATITCDEKEIDEAALKELCSKINNATVLLKEEEMDSLLETEDFQAYKVEGKSEWNVKIYSNGAVSMRKDGQKEIFYK